MRKLILPLILLLILSASAPFPVARAQEANGSISFQPSEIPNIGFKYNNKEYRFELTWKGYYLNIKPFAIYNGQYYDLKQIIPFLKNQYQNVDYRTAVQKFKNYHRWGFWLEKLPQNVADNLDYLGFELDYNIPLNVIEIEEIEDYNFTFKRIHIGGKFTMDFYDLYKRGFEVSINRTTILVGNVKGKTDIDLDPITYAAPIITVTGFTEGTPATFWDVWNASNVNGWGVVYNNQVNDTQYQIDCKLKIGEGTTETWFSDSNKEITFLNGTVANNQEWLIKVKNNATLIFGEVISENWRLTTNGIALMSLEDSYTGTDLINNNDGTIYLYSSYFNVPSYGGRSELFNIDRIWNSLLVNNIAIYNTQPSADIYNVIITGSWLGVNSPQGRYEKISLIGITDRPMNFEGAISSTISNPIIVNLNAAKYTFTTFSLTESVYIIDMEHNYPIVIDWGLTNTGEIYNQYTFNIVVVDKDGNPVENADVTLTYSGQGEGTIGSWSTPVNGSIPEQTISKGFYNQTGGDTIYPYEPYNITIEATGYLPQTFIFNVSTPIDWETPLIETEDGIVIENNFPLAFISFMFAALGFMYYGWTQYDNENSLIGFVLSLLFWVATIGQWIFDTSTDNNLILWWVFLAPLLLCVIKISEVALAYMERGEKNLGKY